MSRLTGVLQKLRSVHTPWLERLTLAHYAWQANDICIPNKHQLLLDWMTSQLAFITRKGHRTVDKETVQMLWSLYLNAIKALDSQVVCAVHLKPTVIEVHTYVHFC